MLIRLATSADRDDMLRIAAQTWDGDDYLPAVLDEWLVDPAGSFFAATADEGGPLLGFARLARLGPDEWWMEAIRVDPEYYGQGIGRALHHYVVAEAQRAGATALRFSTGGSNQAIHKLARETDFEIVGRYALYRADTNERLNTLPALGSLTPFAPEQIPLLRDFLNDSPHYQHVDRSMERDWKWLRLSDERLQQEAAAGRVYGWYLAGVLQGTVIFYPPPAKKPGQITMLGVSYLDAVPGKLAVMGMAVRGLAAQLGYRRVQHRLITRPERLVAMEQGGWRRRGYEELLLFKRVLTV